MPLLIRSLAAAASLYSRCHSIFEFETLSPRLAARLPLMTIITQPRAVASDIYIQALTRARSLARSSVS